MPDTAIIQAFRAIDLAGLEAGSGMLRRLDHKYVIAAPALQRMLERCLPLFDVLEIDGMRSFTYDTRYFDDPEHTSYLDHLRGRRRRYKVRVRRYLEARLCFVEVKLKDKRGITVKRRLEHPYALYGQLDERARRFVRETCEDFYGPGFARPLAPTVEMRYRRTTLVARTGGERATIDAELVFEGSRGRRAVGDRLFIVETKSANGHGLADRILRSLHQHPTPGCSKYCTALAALREVDRRNRFIPALRRLGLLEPGAVVG